MINLGDSRLDLFLVEVIDFIFSENMQNRAEQIHQFGKNLILKIADKHDIILMKCATNRIRDEEDIVNIVKINDIDWKILIDEAKKHGPRTFSLHLFGEPLIDPGLAEKVKYIKEERLLSLKIVTIN